MRCAWWLPGGRRRGGRYRDVGVRAWFIKVCEGSDGVKEEGTVGDMNPAVVGVLRDDRFS